MQNYQGCLKIAEENYQPEEVKASAQLFAVYRSTNALKEDSSYFVKILCNGFSGEGLDKGDIVKVDGDVKAKTNDTVLIQRNNELILKKWVRLKDDFYLYPETPGFHSVNLNSSVDFEILGVVTNVMKTSC